MIRGTEHCLFAVLYDARCLEDLHQGLQEQVVALLGIQPVSGCGGAGIGSWGLGFRLKFKSCPARGKSFGRPDAC